MHAGEDVQESSSTASVLFTKVRPQPNSKFNKASLHNPLPLKIPCLCLLKDTTPTQHLYEPQRSELQSSCVHSKHYNHRAISQLHLSFTLNTHCVPSSPHEPSLERNIYLFFPFCALVTCCSKGSCCWIRHLALRGYVPRLLADVPQCCQSFPGPPPKSPALSEDSASKRYLVKFVV